jgi:hypothetical protein
MTRSWQRINAILGDQALFDQAQWPRTRQVYINGPGVDSLSRWKPAGATMSIPPPC